MSTGAISATKQLASADLKYSLPELLINIEMLIFSILHLWAFAWKSYATASPGARVTDFYGNGKASDERGRGGFQALADAMNPFDLLKAIGRSARWLVVGRRKRTQDPSYQQHHEAIGLQPPESEVTTNVTTTAYPGATAMSGGRTGRYGGDEQGEVLLANAQSNPTTTQLGTSPWDRDSDDYFHRQPNHLYEQRGSSPYDNNEQQNTAYKPHETSSEPHPDPGVGPLRLSSLL